MSKPAWLNHLSALLAGLGILCAGGAARADDALACHVGIYKLSDGRTLDIAPEDDPTLRWTLWDGSTGVLHAAAGQTWTSTLGWSKRSDGHSATFSSCADGGIQFDGLAGHRMALKVQDLTFQSHGTKLVGRLVMPPGTDKVPVVILIHGAEHDSALEGYALQRMLPAKGVGAFVYDKRGTGKSQGDYTQDYSLLADDVVAATNEARRLAHDRVARIGYQAGSQGGWVAPLAANRTPVDFVVVCFGLAVNVIDEDQQAVQLQLSEKGYSPREVADALEVARAAENIFVSDFTQGFDEFDALRAKYKSARWYKDLRGDFTFFFMPYSQAELRAMASKFKWHVPFHYDPMPPLKAAKTPELWILGGEDYEAPSAETRKRLNGLIEAGHPFSVAYYPRAEHGMTLFEDEPDGSRTSTRYAPDYFQMMLDFIRDGRLHGKYGDAQLSPPAGR